MQRKAFKNTTVQTHLANMQLQFTYELNTMGSRQTASGFVIHIHGGLVMSCHHFLPD